MLCNFDQIAELSLIRNSRDNILIHNYQHHWEQRKDFSYPQQCLLIISHLSELKSSKNMPIKIAITWGNIIVDKSQLFSFQKSISKRCTIRGQLQAVGKTLRQGSCSSANDPTHSRNMAARVYKTAELSLWKETLCFNEARMEWTVTGQPLVFLVLTIPISFGQYVD